MILSKEDKAHLDVAYSLGFIDSPSEDALLTRWKKYNSENHEFGPSHLCLEGYIEMEKTSFMLRYVKNDKGEISNDSIKIFYDENIDLFTRAEGDIFELFEVSEIIKKRIKEKEYFDYVERVLLQYNQ